MEADHALVQKNRGGEGRDLIQGILTQTKIITDCKHHHLQKPEAVTVTSTPDFIHQILCIQNIGQDHYPNCQYIHRKTVAKIQTLPQKNHVRLHNLHNHPIHDGEKLANVETLPQTNNVRHHNPNCDPIHGREKLTNVDTILQRSHLRDHDPIHGREKLANVERLPQRSDVRDHNIIHGIEKLTNGETLHQRSNV